MIHEIDTALDRLISTAALEGSGTEVVFDAPTKDWAGRRNTPTVNLYLYDIREDQNRRHVGVITERDAEGRVIARGEPMRYFRLTYLATAWAQRPQDEHRLLSAMLSALLRNKVLPAEYLTGQIADTGAPVLLEVGRPPDSRQISEVWTALGGELKASLDVVVTAAMSFEPVTALAPVPEGGIELGVAGTGGQAERSRQPAITPAADGVEDEEEEPVAPSGWPAGSGR